MGNYAEIINGENKTYMKLPDLLIEDLDVVKTDTFGFRDVDKSINSKNITLSNESYDILKNQSNTYLVPIVKSTSDNISIYKQVPSNETKRDGYKTLTLSDEEVKSLWDKGRVDFINPLERDPFLNYYAKIQSPKLIQGQFDSKVKKSIESLLEKPIK